MSSLDPALPRAVIGQVSICHGPACGPGSARLPNDRPPIARAALIADWRKNGLYPDLHLCFSGCLGCCAQAPVIGFAHAQGACIRSVKNSLQGESELIQWAARITAHRSWIDAEVGTDVERFKRQID